MNSQPPHRKEKMVARRSLRTAIPTVARRWQGSHAATHPGTQQEREFDALRISFRRSLQSLQLFLAISVSAFLIREVDLYATLPESLLWILGCPPPPLLAHLALAGYIFTVLTPLTIHLLTGEQPVSQWRHLGYRSAFYAFYLFSNTLTANFILVFATGVILYLLEQASLCLAISRAGHIDRQPAS